jgi:hypothetical protein
MKNWINKDIKSISNALHKIISYEKLLGTNTTSKSTTLYCKINSLLVGKETSRSNFLHHIPHFSEVYFNFLSIVIWQKDVFKIHANDTACINSLVILDSAKHFWEMAAESHDWIHGLVEVVDKHWNVPTILNQNCLESMQQKQQQSLFAVNNKVNYIGENKDISSNRQIVKSVETNNRKFISYEIESWFIHASDAYLIGY